MTAQADNGYYTSPGASSETWITMPQESMILPSPDLSPFGQQSTSRSMARNDAKESARQGPELAQYMLGGSASASSSSAARQGGSGHQTAAMHSLNTGPQLGYRRASAGQQIASNQQMSRFAYVMRDDLKADSGQSNDPYRLATHSPMDRQGSQLTYASSVPSSPMQPQDPYQNRSSHQHSASFSGSGSAPVFGQSQPPAFRRGTSHNSSQLEYNSMPPPSGSYSQQQQPQRADNQSRQSPRSPLVTMSPLLPTSRTPAQASPSSAGPSMQHQQYYNATTMDPMRMGAYSPSQYAPQQFGQSGPPPAASSASRAPHSPSTSYQQAPSQGLGIATASTSSQYSRPMSASRSPSQLQYSQQYGTQQQYYVQHSPNIQRSSSTSQAPSNSHFQRSPQPQQRQSTMPTQQTWPSARRKGFRRIKDPSELRPVVNAQPVGRRADPSGGFISVRLSLEEFVGL